MALPWMTYLGEDFTKELIFATADKHAPPSSDLNLFDETLNNPDPYALHEDDTGKEVVAAKDETTLEEPEYVIQEKVGGRKSKVIKRESRKHPRLSSSFVPPPNQKHFVYYNEKTGWGTRVEQGESLVLDLPTSLSRLPLNAKPLYLRMTSPNKDYYQEAQHTSDDVLRQQISHHLLEVSTNVRALMDKAPSSSEKTKALESEMAALKEENLVLKNQMASAETWKQQVLERDPKIWGLLRRTWRKSRKVSETMSKK